MKAGPIRVTVDGCRVLRHPNVGLCGCLARGCVKACKVTVCGGELVLLGIGAAGASV
jgi:hypothetical protein